MLAWLYTSGGCGRSGVPMMGVDGFDDLAIIDEKMITYLSLNHNPDAFALINREREYT